MPARFGRIAAHAVGDQTKPGRIPRLRRQLQTPPFAQIQRAGDFDHHEGQSAILQGLLGHGQTIGLVLGSGQQKPRRIEKICQSQWVDHLASPCLGHPKGPAGMRCGQCGKACRTRPANLMNACSARRKTVLKCRHHAAMVRRRAGSANRHEDAVAIAGPVLLCCLSRTMIRWRKAGAEPSVRTTRAARRFSELRIAHDGISAIILHQFSRREDGMHRLGPQQFGARNWALPTCFPANTHLRLNHLS